MAFLSKTEAVSHIMRYAPCSHGSNSVLVENTVICRDCNASWNINHATPTQDYDKFRDACDFLLDPNHK
jgi:hypothetical protein